MKRLLELPSMEVEDRGDGTSVLVNVDDLPLWQWCLELLLLKEGLIEKLTIAGKKDDVKLSFYLSTNPSLRRAAILQWQYNEIDIQVSVTEIEYWLSWLLKYYRDGIAEVDHIDVEIDANKDKTRGIDLMLLAEHFLPPVSAEEAEKRLSQ